ncbi:MAG: Ig domain-containing protein [Gaiellaceae bacterium]
MRIGVIGVLCALAVAVPAAAGKSAGPYDGSWQGTFDGTISIAGHSTRLYGPLTFRVDDGVISGMVGGTVGSSGVGSLTSFSFVGVTVRSCSGSARFTRSSANGSISCTTNAGDRLSGNIAADRSGGPSDDESSTGELGSLRNNVPGYFKAYVGERFATPLCRRGEGRGNGLPKNRLCGPPTNPGTAPWWPRGGKPPYTFNLKLGKGFLPKGLVLNHNTGWIEGTPEPGTDLGGRRSPGFCANCRIYDFTVCVRDSSGKTVCEGAFFAVYPRR